MNRETVELKPGDRIKDNDPRRPNRILTVRTISNSRSIVAEAPNGRLVIVSRDRIYEDEVPRNTGFTLLKGQL